MRDNRFVKLKYCVDKGINYFDLLKPPRRDYHIMAWTVMTEGGERRVFDTEEEAEDFYKNNMPEELR